jgi:hypothetical protein
MMPLKFLIYKACRNLKFGTREDNIKIAIEGIGCNQGECIQLIAGRDQQRNLVKPIINFRTA